jgi:hypothetical protein
MRYVRIKLKDYIFNACESDGSSCVTENFDKTGYLVPLYSLLSAFCH